MSRPNIFPALRYRDGRAAIDWLVRAFGFEEQAVVPSPDGGIAHAQLALGPAVVGLSSGGAVSDNPWSQVRQGIYVRVAGIDAHHDRAKAAGAEILQPLRDTEYGSREYAARDVDGHLWGFGTYDMQSADGLPAVYPELRYQDGARAMEFLSRAFGFDTVLRVPGPNGSVLHAEMALGDGIVMLGSGHDELGLWGDLRQCTHVYVADPDAHFARASAAGASIARPLHNTPWKSRGYVVRDVEGFLWGFSTYRPVAAARV